MNIWSDVGDAREENEGEIEQEQVKWSRSSASGSIGWLPVM